METNTNKTITESTLRMTLMQLSETKLELAAVTEQRDGLAEALERISEYQGVDDEDPKTMAIEALQSLNQPAVKGGNHES